MELAQEGVSAANLVVALIASYGLSVLGAIAILIGGWLMSRMLHAGIVRVCGNSRRIDRTVTLFLANGARHGVLAFTFVAVLTKFGIETTSFVAVLGAFGVAVGLALQGTLSNLAAGIMLILFRPFHIGDRIEANGVVGTTREINLFYSELDTDENVRVVMPNGMLWGAVVKIPSRNDTERVELRFTRPLADDIGTAIARLRAVIDRDSRVAETAQVGVDAVNEGNYVLVARLWVPRRDALQVHFDLNRAVKEDFERGRATAKEYATG